MATYLESGLRLDLPDGQHFHFADLPAKLTIHLRGLRDSLNACQRGRVALADVRNVVLFDYARLVADPRFSGFVKVQPL